MAMDPERYFQLSDAQRETLRLFHAHLQIKEIANELKIAESTVNHRLAQSRAILGFNSSRAAARWMAGHEEELRDWSKTTSSSAPMAFLPDLSPDGEVGTVEGDQKPAEAEHEPIITENDDDAFATRAGISWPFPTSRRQTNDLSWKARLMLVLPVALILMIGIMTLAVLGLGFQELLVSFETLISRLP